MLIAFPRKPGPQSVLTISVLPSSPTCPSTLFISSWSEDPLSADGFQAVGQLEGGSCNGHEGMATALQCNPLNNHHFQSTLLPLLKAAAAGHILSLFPIIFALRHFRLQNIPFSLSQVCRSARFCEISTAHNLSECDPVVQYERSSLLVFKDIRSRG